MDARVGDVVITSDEARWRIDSIQRDGARLSFVALNLSSPAVITADVSRLTWSEADGAWRLGTDRWDES